VSRSLACRRRPPHSTGGLALTLILSRPRRCSLMLRPVWPADPQEGPFPEVLQTIRHLLIRSGCFRLSESCRVGFAPTTSVHLGKAHVESTTGAVAVGGEDQRFTGGFRLLAGALVSAVAPFPVAARQTGHADSPHPAFSCVIKPSRSAGRHGVAARHTGRASRRDTRPDTGDTRCRLVRCVASTIVADAFAHTSAPTCRSEEPALG
jgi:hypothetical protein